MGRSEETAEPPGEAGAETSARVRIWDAPTRLVHWAIAILFGVSWWTHVTDHMDWHKLSGYALLTLVLFRLFWGVAGSSTARFGRFVRGPQAVVAYARRLRERRVPPSAGHNPMGGWSVLALLALLLIQTGLGLFSVDTDGMESGPLASFVSFDTGRLAAHWHGRVFNALLVLIGLHLAAVLYYLVWRRENLVAAMIGGSKRLSAAPGAVRFASPWLALAGLAAAALVVAGLVRAGHG